VEGPEVLRNVEALYAGVLKRLEWKGRGLGDNPDIEHQSLSVEVKARASFPAWLEDALRQAESSARNGKIPAVVLHQDRGQYPDALVLLRLSEFAELVELAGESSGRTTKKGPGRNS